MSIKRSDPHAKNCGVVGNILVIKNDPINHPFHYTKGKIECIDFIEDKELSFHLGNVVKYIVRAKHKGRYIEDLQKAAYYLNREIARTRTK